MKKIGGMFFTALEYIANVQKGKHCLLFIEN